MNSTRWLEKTLKLAEKNEFSGHSTRAASSLAASEASVSVEAIIEAVEWNNALTFQKYYNKPLQTKADFGYLLLLALESWFFDIHKYEM